MLVQYVRDKHRNPIGVVVAIGSNAIGWSLCHSKLDKFNKELGIQIAMGRATVGSNSKLPSSVMNTFNNMIDRANRYYK